MVTILLKVYSVHSSLYGPGGGDNRRAYATGSQAQDESEDMNREDVQPCGGSSSPQSP